MTHFPVLVVMPGRDPDALGGALTGRRIDAALWPYREDTGDGHGDGERGVKWDWHVIGGRWAGALGDYDPDTDPRNYGVCNLCDGTGLRRDELGREHRERDPDYGCNGCGSSYEEAKVREFPALGMDRNWSNVQVYEAGDIRPVSLIRDDFVPFAFITPDGEWIEQGEMGWWAEVKDKKDEAIWESQYRTFLAQHQDKMAAIVDCHI
jgi:hypothetical protein